MVTKGKIITDIDIEGLQAYADNPSITRAAKSICMSDTAFRYHIRKIRSITGLNPCIFCDMVQLYQKYVRPEDSVL